jgi:hypothetical protein
MKKLTIHTIARDGVVDIQKVDSFHSVPKECEYRIIVNRSQQSYASPGFAAAWKAKTLPEFKPSHVRKP